MNHSQANSKSRPRALSAQKIPIAKSKEKIKTIKNNQEELHFIQTLSHQYSDLLQSVTNIKYPQKHENNKNYLQNDNKQKKLKDQYNKLLQLNKVMKQEFQTKKLRYQQQQKVLTQFLQVSDLKNIYNFISKYQEKEYEIMKLHQKYDNIDKQVIQQRGRRFLDKKVQQVLIQYQQSRNKRMAAQNKHAKLKTQLEKAQKQYKKLDHQLIDYEIKTRKLQKDLVIAQKERRQSKLKKITNNNKENIKVL